jgi:hypothetical protein
MFESGFVRVTVREGAKEMKIRVIALFREAW